MKTSLPPLVPAAAKATPHSPLRGWPLLRLGFRPFYLCAALLACVAVPVWVAALLGGIQLNLPVAPLLWHAHEMLFGFATAVIVGFLLTAVKAWTGLATPRGAALAGLALLWLAARVAAVAAPYAVYAMLDAALLPVVAAVLLEILLRAHNRRNLPLVGILLLLSVANALFHLAVLDAVDLPPVRALYAGLALIVMIECVIAGRVVPAFTMGVNPGLKITMHRGFEGATLAVTGLALALWVLAPPGLPTLAACALAAVLHGARLWQWHPRAALSRPILWILHASYAWIPVGFALLACAQTGAVSMSAGVHALAVGATGGLIIGMVTRTARGHTGRPLQASRAEVLAYALVMAAAVLRVLVPLAAPQWYAAALVGAALAWSSAFAIYLVLFTPWLTASRLDGKDG
ncbi:short-chain dehydrogenase [Rhodococcus sp. SRB_17]|nr:short-chain dehydrogenase [Rhodococcus sp. SRB_17]